MVEYEFEIAVQVNVGDKEGKLPLGVVGLNDRLWLDGLAPDGDVDEGVREAGGVEAKKIAALVDVGAKFEHVLV